MSFSTIDERIVEMRFDNSDFEKNVKTSINTLDKLKESLDFKEGTGGLDNLSKGLNNLQYGGLDSVANAVDSISDRFSNLGVIGMTVLTNLTNKAVDAGLSIVKSLSTDQMSSGWTKYEEEVTAIQTIMHATKAPMEEVQEQMDKLMWFTDETSYNFTDMVNNIGKFTSNGRDLDESVAAMEGIATWAATCGQNATGAARAMYNLSQAIGLGSVKIQDWRSIEGVTMASPEFKQLAMDVAAAYGTLATTADGMYAVNDKNLGTAKQTLVTLQTFDSTLKDEWFTSDVLLTVLNEYSKYAEIIHGLNSEQNVLTADINKMVDAFANSPDKSLEFLYQYSDIIEGLGYSVEEFLPIIQELSSEEYELSRSAFEASQETKTFSEALAAIKDAASTQWMNIFQNIFGNYEQSKEYWGSLVEDLYKLFVDPVRSKADLFTQANKSVSGLSEKIEKLGYSSEAFYGHLKEIGSRYSVDFDSIIKEYGSLEGFLSNLNDLEFTYTTEDAEGNTITKAKKYRDLIYEALGATTELVNGLDNAGTSGTTTVHTLSEMEQIVHDIREGLYGNGADRRKALAELGFETESAEARAAWEKMILKQRAGQALTEEDIAAVITAGASAYDELASSVGTAGNALKAFHDESAKNGQSLYSLLQDVSDAYLDGGAYLPTFQESFTKGLTYIAGTVLNIVGAVRGAWAEIFPETTAKDLKEFAFGFRTITEKIYNLTSGATGLKGALELLLIPVKALGEAAKFILFNIPTLISGVALLLSPIIDFVGLIGRLSVNLMKTVDIFGPLKVAFTGLSNIFNQAVSVGQTFYNVFKGIVGAKTVDYLTRKFEALGVRINNLKDTISNFSDRVVTKLQKLEAYIQTEEFISKFTEKLRTLKAWLVDIKTSLVEAKNSFIDWFKGSQLGTLLRGLKKAFLSDDFKNGISAAFEVGDGPINKLKNVLAFVKYWTKSALQESAPEWLQTLLGMTDKGRLEGIKDMFTAIKESVLSEDGKLMTFINDFKTTFGKSFRLGLVEALKNGDTYMERIQNGCRFIRDTIKEFVKSQAPEWLLNLYRSGRDIFSSVKNQVASLFENTSFENFFAGIEAPFEWAKAKIESIIEYVSGKIAEFKALFSKNNVGDPSDGAADNAEKKAGLFDGLLSKLSVKSFLAVGGVGAMLVQLAMLAKAMTSIASVFGKISKLGKAFSNFDEFIENVKDVIGLNGHKSSFVETITGIAVSVLALAAALKLISTIDAADMKRSLIALGGIVSGFIVLYLALSAVNKAMGASGAFKAGSGIGMLAMAASILVLVTALAAIAALIKMAGGRTMLASFAILEGLLITFAASCKAIGKTNFSIGKALGAIIMANALLSLVVVLAAIAVMIKLTSTGTLVGSLVVLNVLILSLTSAAKKLGKSNMSAKSAVGAIALAASLLVLAKSMGELCAILNTYGYRKVAAAFGILELMLITLVKISNSMTKSTGGLKNGIGTLVSSGALLITVVALAGMVKVLKQLSSVVEEIGGGFRAAKLTLGLAAIEFLLYILGAIVKSVGSNGIKAGIGSIFSSLALLIVVGALTKMIGALSKLYDVVSKLGADKSIRLTIGLYAIVGLVAALGVLINVMSSDSISGKGKLNFKNAANMLAAAASIYIAVQAVSNIVDALSKLANVQGDLSFSQYWTKTGGVFSQMMLLLVELEAFIVIAGKFSPPWGSLAAGGALWLAVDAVSKLAGVLQQLGTDTGIDYDVLDANLLRLGECVGALEVVVATMGVFGEGIGIAGAGIGVGAFLTGAGIWLVLDKINEFLATIDGLDPTTVEKFSTDLSNGLVEFGKLDPGDMSPAIANLETLCKGIARSFRQLTIARVSTSDAADAINGIAALGPAIPSLISGIKEFEALDDETLATFEKGSGILTSIVSAFSAADMANNSLLEKIGFKGTSESDNNASMKTFAEGISAYAEHIPSLIQSCTAFADLTQEQVRNITTGTSALTRIVEKFSAADMKNNTLFERVGIAAESFGLKGTGGENNNTMITFAKGLEAYSGGITELITACAKWGELKTEQVTQVQTGLGIITDLVNLLTDGDKSNNSLFEKIGIIDQNGTANNASMITFADGLDRYATSLTGLCDTMKLFSMTQEEKYGVTRGITALNSLLSALIQSDNDNNSFFEKIGILDQSGNGNNASMESFSTGMTKFGEGVSSLIKPMEDLAKIEGIENLELAREQLSRLLDVLTAHDQGNGTDYNMLFDNQSLLEYCGVVKQFGTSIRTLITDMRQLEKIDVDAVSAGQTKLESLLGILEHYTARTNKQSNLQTAAVDNISKYVDSITELMTSLKASLSDGSIIESDINPIESLFTSMTKEVNTDNVNTAFTTLFDEITSNLTEGISDASEKMKSKGEKLVANLASGMGSKIKMVETQAQRIANAAVNTINESIKGMSSDKSILTSLLSVGEDDIDLSTVESSVSSMLTKIKNYVSTFRTTGESYGSNLASGIGSKAGLVSAQASRLVSSATNAISGSNSSFSTAGSNMGQNLADGISSKSGAVSGAAATIANAGVTELRKAYYFNQAYALGQDFGQGYANGIASKESAVADAARKIAAAASSATAAAQRSNSPSKVAMQLGNYFGEGYAIGIQQLSSSVEGSAQDLVNEAVSIAATSAQMIANVLATDLDSAPVITPVLDLSNVEAGASRLSSLISATSYTKAASASSLETGSSVGVQNGIDSKSAPTYSFVQNNYSPKALSRTEIYRQTKNQISSLSGANL